MLDQRFVSLKAAMGLAAEWGREAMASRDPLRMIRYASKAVTYRDLASELAAAILPGSRFDGSYLIVAIRCADVPREVPVEIEEFARLAGEAARRRAAAVPRPKLASLASCNDSAILSPRTPCDGGTP